MRELCLCLSPTCLSALCEGIVLAAGLKFGVSWNAVSRSGDSPGEPVQSCLVVKDQEEGAHSGAALYWLFHITRGILLRKISLH